jgi:hypothetical protein
MFIADQYAAIWHLSGKYWDEILNRIPYDSDYDDIFAQLGL